MAATMRGRHKTPANHDTADRVLRQFDTLTHGSSTNYIKQTMAAYERELAQSGDGVAVIDHAINRMSALAKRLVVCSDQALQDDGVGPEFRRIDQMASPIRKMIASLEEICCQALSDPQALLVAYHSGSLMY